MLLSWWCACALIIVGIAGASCLPSKVYEDDFSVIRNRTLIDVWPDMAALPSVVADAKSAADLLNSTCYFPDIDYNDQQRANWPALTHINRVAIMVAALTQPSSPIFEDKVMFAKMSCALDVWLKRKFTNSNWWFALIGVPLQVSRSLLMLGLNRTTVEQQKLMLDECYGASWWINDEGGGANLVWMLQIQVYRSIATYNMSGLDQAFSTIWTTVVIEPDTVEGMMVDYGYHFHSTQFQGGAYGDVFTEDILSFFAVSEGTHWALPSRQLNAFAEFIVYGQAFISVGAVWDWHSIGRAIDRPGPFSVSFTPAQLRHLAPLTNYTQLLLNFADRLENIPSATPLIGNHHFFTSDVHVHRRRNWMTSLKVFSIRTIDTECGNGENQKGEHLNAGVLNLYTNLHANGQEYLNIFPLLDWSMINGITVEYDEPLTPCPLSSNFPGTPKAFVGGVSDNVTGVVAMDTHTHNLTLQRAWSFTDDFVVALNTNVSDHTSREIRTTLASRRLFGDSKDAGSQVRVGFVNGTSVVLADGQYNALMDVQYVLCGDVAYLIGALNGGVIVGVRVGEETANFSDIGPYNGRVSARMTTVWMIEGRRLQQAKSQYAIAPAVTFDEMPQVLRHFTQSVDCVINNGSLQAVTYLMQHEAHIIIWPSQLKTQQYTCAAGNLDVSFESTGIYMIKQNATAVTVSMSHPTELSRSVSVTLNNVIVSGTGCVNSGSASVITLTLPSDPNYLGQTVSVTCNKSSRLAAE